MELSAYYFDLWYRILISKLLRPTPKLGKSDPSCPLGYILNGSVIYSRETIGLYIHLWIESYYLLLSIVKVQRLKSD